MARNIALPLFLLLVSTLVMATSVRVSEIAYPREVLKNTETKINISVTYGFTDGGAVKVELFLLNGSTSQPVGAPKYNTYAGGTEEFIFNIPTMAFVDLGEKKFTYKVSYSDSSTNGFIVCAGCTGLINITVVEQQQAPLPAQPNTNTSTASSNRARTNNQSLAPQNSGAADNQTEDEGGVPNISDLLDDETTPQLQDMQPAASAPADNNLLLIGGGLGALCCITVLVIAIIGGGVWHFKKKEPQQPESDNIR